MTFRVLTNAGGLSGKLQSRITSIKKMTASRSSGPCVRSTQRRPAETGRTGNLCSERCRHRHSVPVSAAASRLSSCCCQAWAARPSWGGPVGRRSPRSTWVATCTSAKRNGIVRLADVLTGHSIRHFVSCLEPRQHPPRRLRSVRQSYPEYQTCDPEEDEPDPGQLPQQCWRSAQLRSVGQIREAQQYA